MTSLPFEDKFVFSYPPDMPPRRWHYPCLEAFMARLASPVPGQKTFLVSAGVGTGKTYLAALLASEVLNKEMARRVVYVCPNRAIKRAVRQTFGRFDIFLTDWSNHRHASEGEGALTQGAVLTYQALAQRPEVHSRHCRTPTLVIFDEIHHLGDRQTWDVAARAAFAHPNTIVLGMSGTPFRADNRGIPFVRSYLNEKGLLCFKPDHTYKLGTAVREGYCRRPDFKWLAADVDVTSGGVTRRHALTRDVQEDLASLLLSGAVRPGAGSRLDALRDVVKECAAEQRKLIIFVGGDSRADHLATHDANTLLPEELLKLGVPVSDVVSVTSASHDAVERLHSFGKSAARILVTVNMVSEGVDIPEISAALFLTSITAKATTIQRIGRTMRNPSGRTDDLALIYMFKDPRYVELAEEIEREILHEIRLRRPPAERDFTEGGGGARPRPEASGVCAWADGLTVDGRTYSRAQVEGARAFVAAENLPQTESFLYMALRLINREGPRP